MTTGHILTIGSINTAEDTNHAKNELVRLCPNQLKHDRIGLYERQSKNMHKSFDFV